MTAKPTRFDLWWERTDICIWDGPYEDMPQGYITNKVYESIKAAGLPPLTDPEYDEAYKDGYADGVDYCRKLVAEGRECLLKTKDPMLAWNLAEAALKDAKKESDSGEQQTKT